MTEPSPVSRFFGGMMMAIGGLMAVLCGLCTGVSEVVFLSEGVETGNYVLPLIFGVAPTLIGVGLFLLGRRLLRSSPRPPGT